MDSKCFEAELDRIRDCYKKANEEQLAKHAAAIEKITKDRDCLAAENRRLLIALDTPPKIVTDLREQNARLATQNHELQASVGLIRKQSSEYRREYEGFRKKAIKTVAILSVVTLVEPVILSQPVIEGIGSLLGISTTEAAAEAAALRNAAKIVRDAAKMRAEIIEDIKKRTPRGKEEEFCVKVGSRVAVKVLEKVQEKLEDKAADVVAERLVGAVLPTRDEKHPRCVKYADAES